MTTPDGITELYTNYSPDREWREVIYLSPLGNYGCALFHGESIKCDDYVYLDPAGEPAN